MQQTVNYSNFFNSSIQNKEDIFDIYSWKLSSNGLKCEICDHRSNQVLVLEIDGANFNIYICKNCFVGNQTQQSYKILNSISNFIKELKQNFDIDKLDEKLLNIIRKFINSLKESIK